MQIQYFHPVDANAMDRCQQLDALMHYLSLGEQRTSLVQIDRPIFKLTRSCRALAKLIEGKLYTSQKTQSDAQVLG